MEDELAGVVSALRQAARVVVNPTALWLAPAMYQHYRMRGQEQSVVVLGRYLDLRQAEFAVSVLRGSGVDAFLDAPYTSSMFPHYMLVSGIALFVRESDLEYARDLLASAGLGEIEEG
jgi:hypothetical protein